MYLSWRQPRVFKLLQCIWPPPATISRTPTRKSRLTNRETHVDWTFVILGNIWLVVAKVCLNFCYSGTSMYACPTVSLKSCNLFWRTGIRFWVPASQVSWFCVVGDVSNLDQDQFLRKAEPIQEVNGAPQRYCFSEPKSQVLGNDSHHVHCSLEPCWKYMFNYAYFLKMEVTLLCFNGPMLLNGIDYMCAIG